MNRLFALIIALSLTGCSSCRQPVPPNPPPNPPPGPATCATACARLTELGCAVAKPTPEGGTCVDVCTNIQDSGVITWNLECMTRATSCDSADTCAVPESPK